MIMFNPQVLTIALINYKITFTGITNLGWAWIWLDCNIAPDRGAWVRTYPGQTSTLN